NDNSDELKLSDRMRTFSLSTSSGLRTTTTRGCSGLLPRSLLEGLLSRSLLEGLLLRSLLEGLLLRSLFEGLLLEPRPLPRDLLPRPERPLSVLWLIIFFLKKNKLN